MFQKRLRNNLKDLSNPPVTHSEPSGEGGGCPFTQLKSERACGAKICEEKFLPVDPRSRAVTIFMWFSSKLFSVLAMVFDRGNH